MISRIFHTVIGLSSVQRYSQTKLINPESVLEHQGSVAFMAFVITSQLNQLGEGFNMGTVLVSSVIHDVDEIGTGDIPRPTKYSSPLVTSALEELAASSVNEIAKLLNTPTMLKLWSDAKNGREGNIVALCDGLSVLEKVSQEASMFGNKTIIDHAGGVRNMLARKFASLEDCCTTERGFDLVREMHLESLGICDQIEGLN